MLRPLAEDIVQDFKRELPRGSTWTTPGPRGINKTLGDQAGAIARTGEPTVPGPLSEMRLPGRTALTQAQVPVQRVTSPR
jgi:hypothetical protein